MKNKKLPSFKDYRTTSDGVMVADIGFKKQLWALDPELDVVWDWAGCRWEIWKFPGQAKKVKKRIDERAFHVMTIQTKDKNFRELGADILLKLQWGSWHRWIVKELCEYFDRMDDNIRRARERAFRNWFLDVAYDTFDYVRDVLKVQVPRRYGIKPGEMKKYLIKVPTGKENKTVLKVPSWARVHNAVAGGL